MWIWLTVQYAEYGFYIHVYLSYENSVHNNLSYLSIFSIWYVTRRYYNTGYVRPCKCIQARGKYSISTLVKCIIIVVCCPASRMTCEDCAVRVDKSIGYQLKGVGGCWDLVTISKVYSAWSYIDPLYTTRPRFFICWITFHFLEFWSVAIRKKNSNKNWTICTKCTIL